MSQPPKSVLSLLAHPDDAEFLCAGTLLRLAQRGWQVDIVTATPGDCGSAEIGPEEIAAIRRQEAARAAALIGARYVCLEERDLAIDYDTVTRRKFTECLRELRPTIVLTHPLADYMADHEIVGRLTRDACFTAPMPNFRGAGEAPHLDHIPYLYYCDAFEPEGEHSSIPTRIVDISATMEQKGQMLAAHASQRDWLQRQHGVDEYLRLQEELARRRGQTIGAAFGEAFCQHRGHPYPQDDLLLAELDNGQEAMTSSTRKASQ